MLRLRAGLTEKDKNKADLVRCKNQILSTIYYNIYYITYVPKKMCCISLSARRHNVKPCETA